MKFYYYILAILTAFTAFSCSESSSTSDNSGFHVSCTYDASLNRDSATLYFLEEDYNKLSSAGLCVVKPGNAFEWQGHVTGPKAAFLKFSNDSVPFYFVLEPGETTIKVHRTSWEINGGQCNKEYTRFMQHRKSIIKEKNKVFNYYLKIAADSTLTATTEKDILAQDSILSDSLHRYTAWRMTTGGPVAVIARERFFNTLPKQYQIKIK